MNCDNMDTHQFDEGHAGEGPITSKMDQCNHSDRHLQDNTRNYSQDDDGTITSPKKEKILSPKSTDCTTSYTPSSMRASTSVGSAENFNDSYFVRNIIPNHHSLPFVKLEPLDLEVWGNASSDGKRTPKGYSFDRELSATHERTEFGLSDMELIEHDQKSFLLKMEIDEENFDDEGQRCEKEVEKNNGDGWATQTNLDREYNTNSGKCGRSLARKTNALSREQYKCDQCGKTFAQFDEMQKHLENHTQHLQDSHIGKFSCELCSKNFTSRDNLRIHMKIHQKSNECIICGRIYSQKCYLRRHMKIHNRPESVGYCKLCDKKFRTDVVLKKHMDSFHNTYTCETCGKKLMGKRMMEYHRLAHEHEIKSHDFCCDTCGEIYKTVDSFQTHLEIHKADDMPYRCDICGRQYIEIDQLRKHMNKGNSHTSKEEELKTFPCDVCGKRYKEIESLEKHMDFHTKKSEFSCSICSKGFSKQTSLDKHLKRHSTAFEELQCKKCDAKFSTKTSRDRHIDIVHTIEPCPICGELFPKGKLKSHKATTHEDKQKCDVCGKYYSGVEGIRRHMQYHARSSLIKKFGCEVCGKKYPSQISLKNHSILHKKTIKCDICGRCFSVKGNLKYHMKIHKRSESVGKCKQCDKKLKTEFLLQKHTTNFHVLHSCDSCGQQFQGKVYLDYHRLAHEHEMKSQDFRCDTCGEIYKTVDSFQTHLEIHKKDDRPYRCDICGKQFIEIDQFRKHMNRGNSHTSKDTVQEEHLKTFPCDVCGKRYKEIDSLEKHMKLHETMKKEFSCSMCNRGFSNQTSLDKHLKRHSTAEKANEENLCEKCDEVFLTKAILDCHINTVHTMEPCNIRGEKFPKSKLKYHKATHEDKQKCDVCGKYYSGVEGMRRHMQYHARSNLIKKFMCEVCGKKYPSQISLKNHSILHKKTIKCDICGRCFSLRGNLRCHMKTHKRPESVGKCKHCDRKFKTKFLLQRHTTNFHVLHSCDSCGQDFQGKEYLHCHELAHEHEMKSHDFCCDTCGEIYKTVDSFQTHLEIHKEDDRPYRCDICGKTFIALEHLGRHMSKGHAHDHHTADDIQEGLKTYSCDVCGKRFRESDSLEKHMNFHTKKRDFNCSTCSRGFTLQSSLDKHLKRHSTARRGHQCEKCNEVFLMKTKLERHINSVHTMKPCNICGEIFPKGKLKYHKATHEDKQKCDVCGKYYSGVEGMRRHMQYHARSSLIKKFGCEVCGKKYPSQISLKNHSILHKKTIKCDICGRCFSLRGNLRCHMKIHKRPESVGKCEHCDKTFKTEFLLQKHTTNFHVKHLCDNCGQNFEGKVLLDYHQLAHEHEIKSRDFCCGTCGEIYETFDSFQTHLEIHKEDDSPYRCDICGKTFIEIEYLAKHMRKGHIPRTVEDIVEEFTFSCDECGRSFKQKQILEKHMKFHETEKKGFSCSFCSRVFTLQSSLDKHFKTHSTAEKASEEYHCEKCDITFHSKFFLNHHVNNVHTMKPCNICGEMFPKGKLKYHRAKHQEKQQCDVCAKYYYGAEGLRRHMLYHIRVSKGTKNFSCDVCGKRYHLQSSLQHHMRLHQKSIKCKVCGRCFSYKSNLHVHMSIHNRPESIGKCEICDMTFKTKGVLQRHINNFHVINSCEICGLKYKETPEKHTNKYHTSHVCDICGVKVEGKLLLECHKLVHVYEKGSFEFRCCQCEERYKTSSKLRRHMDIHMKDEEEYDRFGCEICGKRFSSLKFLTSHVNIHRKEIGHNCKICGKVFKEIDEEHKCPSEKICNYTCTCSVCGHRFQSESALQKHKEIHGKDGRIEFECEQCNWKFTTERRLQNHIDKIHGTKLCDICGQELPICEMSLHKRTVHVEKYMCDICGHNCNGFSNLTKHLKTHSAKKADTFCCDICCKTFDSAAGLKTHKFIHPGTSINERTVVCDVCGKGFQNKTRLYYHMFVHKPKTLQCKICYKKFATKSTLLNHAKCRRQCQTCGKRFVDTRLFKQHVEEHHNGAERVHEDVSLETSSSEGSNPSTSHNDGPLDAGRWKKYGCPPADGTKKISNFPHKCPVCKREFQSEINMKNHLAKKHDNKLDTVLLFQCDACLQLFTSKHAVRSHKKKMHSEKHLDISRTKSIVTDQNRSTHKEQDKGQVSRRESMESIDKEGSIDGSKVARTQLGLRGHKRESMIPLLTPQVISEDSMFLPFKDIMKLPPEKAETVKDERNFLSMVIRKSVDELNATTIKRGQYLQIVTKMKELILNKNLDEPKIKKRLKSKVSGYISYKLRYHKKKELAEETENEQVVSVEFLDQLE